MSDLSPFPRSAKPDQLSDGVGDDRTATAPIARLDVPEMLMVGATGRNAGKTTLACRMIDALSRRGPVIAVKVTTVETREGPCPRGGQGCGVCSSFEGEWLITEERDGPAEKDTVRLLRAGASRVYWLRARRSRLFEAAADLLLRTGRGVPIVCESNSLRHAVNPGAFVMMTEKGSTSCKASARTVRALSDRVVAFDGEKFEPDVDDIEFADGHWTMKAPASAVILAGGASTRMGRDKSMMLIEGRPLIARIHNALSPLFDEVVISANDSEKFAFLGARVVPDRRWSQGPLMGIVSAMESTRHDVNFIVACDTPDIDTGLVRSLLSAAANAEGAVPLAADGRVEPLFAVYRKSLLDAFHQVLERGGRRIRDAWVGRDIRLVPLASGDIGPVNLNTRQDVEDYLQRRRSAVGFNDGGKRHGIG